MPSFNPSVVHRPTSIEETCALLHSYSGRARIVAGNTTLYELGKQGALEGIDALIDIGKIGLVYVRKHIPLNDNESPSLIVGAGTTFSEIGEAEHAISVEESYYALREVSLKITPSQIRNSGTIGGAVCSGIPFYDMAAVVVALDAKMKVVNSSGERLIDAKDFFVDYFTTALSEEDLLTEIQFPSFRNSGSAFLKLGRTSVDFSVVNACTMISLDNTTNKISDARVVLGAVSSVPLRMNVLEEQLRGKYASEETFRALAKLPIDIHPSASVHASTEYKRKIIPVLIRDALLVAAKRAAS